MIKLSQIISLFIFAPFFLYPFSYCPFKLPYLYCFLCPAPCGWKRTRWLLLLIVLGLNIKGGLFCRRLCPFGTVQDILSKVKSGKFVLSNFTSGLKYSILALILIVLVTTLTPAVFAFKFSGLFLSRVVFVAIKYLFIAILLFGVIASIFIYRPFCNNFCPFRTLGEIFAKFRK